MIATSHVIIGGTIGIIVAQTTNDPIAGAATAFSTGIVSHLMGDLIPHLDLPPKAKFIGEDVIWDRSLYIFALIDSLIAFFFTLFVWIYVFDFNLTSPYAWGAFGGYFPDFVDNFPAWRLQIRQFYPFQKFHNFHLAIHRVWRVRYPMPQYWLLGTVTQLVAVGACALYFAL